MGARKAGVSVCGTIMWTLEQGRRKGHPDGKLQVIEFLFPQGRVVNADALDAAADATTEQARDGALHGRALHFGAQPVGQLPQQLLKRGWRGQVGGPAQNPEQNGLTNRPGDGETVPVQPIGLDVTPPTPLTTPRDFYGSEVNGTPPPTNFYFSFRFQRA